MLDNLLAPLRAKYRVAAAQAACYAVASIAVAIALAFALAALFSWLSGLYGTIAACLIVAGAFVLVALVPLFILLSIQRREQLRLAQAAARARSAAWLNPATLSLGLQAARMFGKNRGLVAGVVGAVLLGWMVSQFAAGTEAAPETDATEPAE